jgi:hypothetical protein
LHAAETKRTVIRDFNFSLGKPNHALLLSRIVEQMLVIRSPKKVINGTKKSRPLDRIEVSTSGHVKGKGTKTG